MNFKQAVIDNAWGGISLDYGLLHLQLATPVTVLIFILAMIFFLNKLLFQPVMRTLDLRREKMDESLRQSERFDKEAERMGMEFERCLSDARKSVMEIHQAERNEGLSGREKMIEKERDDLEEEMIKQTGQLQQEFAEVQKRFIKLSQNLSSQVSERILN